MIDIKSNVQIELDDSCVAQLSSKLQQNGPWDDWQMVQLAYEATEATLIKNFHELTCLPHLTKFTPLPHQISTAHKVLSELRGRAILADEVGLGKTIEAGLILKEYMTRGLVRKVLVLVPASLVLQWTRELN